MKKWEKNACLSTFHRMSLKKRKSGMGHKINLSLQTLCSTKQEKLDTSLLSLSPSSLLGISLQTNTPLEEVQSFYHPIIFLVSFILLQEGQCTKEKHNYRLTTYNVEISIESANINKLILAG